MKPIIALVLFTSGAIVAGGCGGTDTVRAPVLYEGKWTGTWTGPETSDSGAFSLAIDAYGNVTGTMGRDPSAIISGTLGGSVNGTGKFALTTTFASSGNFVMNGQMTVTTNGSLTGSFTYLWNGSTYTGSFTTTGTTTPNA